MADWRDVMGARSDADKALANVDAYGGMLEDGREPNAALAICLATSAVCAELRALAVAIDYKET